MNAMLASDLPLPRIGRGKVRDIYAVGEDRVLLLTTDRISAFDVVMAETIPMKGAVLTQISAWWFRRLEGMVPHHMISADADAIIADVAENGVLDDELQMAKDKTEAAMIFALDQPSAFGSLMGKAATFGLSPDATLHYIAAQKDVTAADVKAAAAKFLRGDHMVTGTLLPQQ